MAGLDYFFDGQLRAYRLQIARIFHGFQYESKTRDGTSVLRQVPVRWGRTDRMVEHIMRNNSENVMNSVPFISVYDDGLSLAPDRRQNPMHYEHIKVAEREFNEETNSYTTKPGNKYSVERIMGVPYNMTIKVDIWTSNQYQKDQLFEQIGVLFNPTMDFQTSTNPLDWTALASIEMKDLSFSSSSVPVGTETPIDILSFSFECPIWINPPAKVYQQKVIQQIVTNILEEHPCFAKGTGVDYYDEDLLGRTIATPMNYRVFIDGNEIWLLSDQGCRFDENGIPLSWKNLLPKYGKFRPATSIFALRKYDAHPSDNSKTIYGTLDYHPAQDNILLWSIDPLTLPGSTMDPINAIIDPHQVFPGVGLPSAANGQRYMMLEDIGGTDGPNGQSGATVAWGPLTASKNDIIMFNGTVWQVVFDSKTATTEGFVTNLYTNKQLHWDKTQWELSIDGQYAPGMWRIYL
jgi:hypothetical protein